MKGTRGCFGNLASPALAFVVVVAAAAGRQLRKKFLPGGNGRRQLPQLLDCTAQGIPAIAGRVDAGGCSLQGHLLQPLPQLLQGNWKKLLLLREVDDSGD